MEKYITNSEEETKKFAKEFAKKLKVGDVIVLTGDLGSGKTKFVEGVLSNFGLENEISSPTFTIVNEYKKDDIKVIYHKDIIKDENLLYKDLSSFEIDKIYEEDENFFVFDLNYEKKLIGNLEISHINETCENELEIIDDLVEDFINKNNITIIWRINNFI